MAGLFTLYVTSAFFSGATQDNRTFFERTLTWELRTEIWKCVDQISKSEGLIVDGFGFNGTKDKLVACYGERIDNPNKRDVFVEVKVQFP